MEPQSLQFPLAEIKQKIQNSRSILVVLPSQHTIDTVAAGLALLLALEQYNSAENGGSKSVQVVTPTDVTVAYQRLYGVGSIQNHLGSKNLVLSLNVPHEAIEKVISTNDNGKFNLIIETKSGTRKLTGNDVEFSYQGVDADLIITVGLSTPEQAGVLLSQEKNLFAEREVVTISNIPGAVAFGTVNYQDIAASGVSEMISRLVRFLKIQIDPDVATNLLAGIEAATNNFSVRTTADTFAAVSWCMRVGGKRNHLGTVAAPVSPFASPASYPSTVPSPFKQPTPKPPFKDVQEDLEPVPPSPFPPLPQEPKPVAEQTDDQEDVNPKEDWFAPKIFRTRSSDGSNKS